MKFLHSFFVNTMFNRATQLGSIVLIAMLLGGQSVRQDFYEMTSELIQVDSKEEFAEWLVHSHYRMGKLTEINWRPISVFPKEAKRFQ